MFYLKLLLYSVHILYFYLDLIEPSKNSSQKHCILFGYTQPQTEIGAGVVWVSYFYLGLIKPSKNFSQEIVIFY